MMETLVVKGLSANVMPPKACVSLRLKNLTMKMCVRNGPEAVARSCSIKRCCQKFRKILRKTPVPESQSLKPGTLLKKRLWHNYFPVNFAKFLGTPFLQNTSGSPLLVLTL